MRSVGIQCKVTEEVAVGESAASFSGQQKQHNENEESDGDEGYRQSPAQLRDSIQTERENVSPALAASLDHPDKETAVAGHISRFNK